MSSPGTRCMLTNLRARAVKPFTNKDGGRRRDDIWGRAAPRGPRRGGAPGADGLDETPRTRY